MLNNQVYLYDVRFLKKQNNTVRLRTLFLRDIDTGRDWTRGTTAES